MALGLLSAVTVAAWAWTRHLRRDWYPRHAIGLAGLAVLVTCLTVGYCSARYGSEHASIGKQE
ncbi:MAG: hypothetical protein ACK4Z8_09065 [Novosphingobium sp.]